MLLLVTILLVVVGTISLVIGFVQSSLLPIYISIACSVLAAVVLLIFSRMTAKSQQVVTSDTGPAPLDRDQPGGRAQTEDPFVGTGLLAGSAGERSGAESDGGTEVTAGWSGQGGDDEDAPGVDDDFPIERYDTRRVGEILPLLAELDLDELDIVREHEEQHKSRATVLARIDQLIDQLETEDRTEEAHRFDEPTAAVVHDEAPGAEGSAPGDDDLDHVVDDPMHSSFESAGAPPVTQAVSVAALPEDDGYFPIEDYDELRADEILPLLPELDDDELVMVQARERDGMARSSVLRRIDSLVATPGASVAEPVPEPMFEPEPEPALAAVVAVPAPPSDPPVGTARKASTKRAAATRKAPPKVTAPKVAATRKVAPPAPPVKKAPAPRKAAASKAMAPVAAKKAAPAGATSVKAAAKKGTAGASRATAPKKSPVVKVSSKGTAVKGGGAPPATKAVKAVKARKTSKS